ncbi:MAG: hypothetical protein M1353_07875 [Nitrospirae bacterium]|nr:hypothetical protein [Nitrospirota bacterium]
MPEQGFFAVSFPVSRHPGFCKIPAAVFVCIRSFLRAGCHTRQGSAPKNSLKAFLSVMGYKPVRVETGEFKGFELLPVARPGRETP